MSYDEVADKFRECAAWGGLAKPNAEKIVDLVFGLEKVKSIRELTRLLAIGTTAASLQADRTRGRKK